MHARALQGSCGFGERAMYENDPAAGIPDNLRIDTVLVTRS